MEAKDKTANIDSLLECLVFLTRHFGRAKSASSLIAGLPYDEKNMGPRLFCEAAEAIDLSTKIQKKAKIASLNPATLPIVVILKDKRAVVLTALNQTQAKLYDPCAVSDESTSDHFITRDLKDLQSDFGGYIILIKPNAAFTNPASSQRHHDDDTKDGPHWFWSVVAGNKNLYAMAMLGAIFTNIFALVSPLFIMNVYDRVIPNNAIETGWALGIGALVIYGFDLILRTLRAYLIDFSGRRIDVIAARRIFDQVLNMRIAARPRSSGVFANMLRDFDSVRDFFTSATITTLVDLPFSIFFLFIIYQLGGMIAFVLCAMIMVVFILGLILQIPLKKHVRLATRSSEAKHGLLVETISGLETIKTIGADGLMRARYMSYVGENARHGQNSRFWSGIGVNIASFLQQSASVIVVLLGMYLVRDGLLSMGALIACVIIGGRAIAPIGQIAALMTRYHHAGSALKTIERIMNSPVDRPPEKHFIHRDSLKGKIAFDHVNFSYPAVDNKILQDVSFTIQPGEKVGIIGKVGSGKSTIARLIMGLYSPDDGTVLFDDTDARQIDPVDIKRACAYISQDITLFNGSVRDNITMSLPHATEAEILDASRQAGVHDFVARHPMGYDAPVGEQGQALSGGQRQSVALARAIISNPSVFVCDEPTNAMDIQSERLFRSYIEEQIKDRTLVLITHKQHMLDLADRLILIDKGRIIMDAPREKVMEALRAGKIEVPA